MPDLLVTGTDTGVGKTVVAAAIILALRERRRKVIGFKPAETGISPGETADSDVLAKASGVDDPRARPLLRLAEPLAPAVAAERAGTPLDPAAVDERIRLLRAAGYTVIVEGAGGALVPLAWDCNALDIARRNGLQAVIVGRAGLGTLNHVLLTFEALRSRRIPVRGVVLNRRAPEPDLAEQTNPEALAKLLPAIPTMVVPNHEGMDALEAAYASVPLVVGVL